MNPKALLRLLFPALLWVCLFGALGCETAPNRSSLLSLTGVGPKELGLSDELEIQGNGFPEGRPARVAFHGDLYRPGTRVERDVEIVARTNTSSPRSLSITMSETLRAAFTGAGDDAKHTTFRGDIEVSFAPKKTGSAPVVGVLSDVVLDIDAPLVSETLQRQRDDDATGALSFLGIALRGPQLGECCVVDHASSRAQTVGLGSGDLLVDLDGVTVRSPYDLVPSGRSRIVRLTYRRAGSGPFITREIDVQGYRSAAPRELGPAAGLIGALALGLLLTYTRLGHPLAWAARWLAVRLRESHTTGLWQLKRTVQERRWLGPRLIGLPEENGWALAATMMLIFISGLTTLIALRVDLVSRELDLVLWMLAQTASVTWAAFLTEIGQSSRSTWNALRCAAAALLHQIPLLILGLVVVVTTSSLRFIDIVSAQGASTLAVNFLKHPPLMLLSAVAVLGLVPVASRPERRSGCESPRGESIRGLGRLLSGTVHLWSTALLIALLSFGGFRVPFVSETAQTASVPWQVLGLLVWVAKGAGLVVVVGVLRRIAGEPTVRDTLPLLLKLGLGLALLGAFTAQLWSHVVHRFALGWVEEVTAWVLFAATLAALVWIVTEAWRLARSNRCELLPNPWL